jgi:hypothetical protein
VDVRGGDKEISFRAGSETEVPPNGYVISRTADVSED